MGYSTVKAPQSTDSINSLNKSSLGSWHLTSSCRGSLPCKIPRYILVNIFKFYHYSATRQSALAEIQSVLNDPQLKLKDPKSVRWLSHALAINAIKRSQRIE